MVTTGRRTAAPRGGDRGRGERTPPGDQPSARMRDDGVRSLPARHRHSRAPGPNGRRTRAALTPVGLAERRTRRTPRPGGRRAARERHAVARAEAKKTTSDLIIERLLAWGGDTCFGICGDQVNGFFESPRTHPGMRFTHVRHEENAALACVGYAKCTGRPAACVATAGPGAIHLLNGPTAASRRCGRDGNRWTRSGCRWPSRSASPGWPW
ncbi:thiamine pyrophosphate-binding protein [Streptomyces halstedii]|uniref:thiamine pyrophosphate-binding protein n=1 Tax=Streptomyces halstedii TaxID=1944 RepID=UPI00382F86E1